MQLLNQSKYKDGVVIVNFVVATLFGTYCNITIHKHDVKTVGVGLLNSCSSLLNNNDN